MHRTNIPEGSVQTQRGRKPLFTAAVGHRLMETATASAYNRRLPLAEVAKLANVKASKRSLRRIFQSEGYNCRIARVKPFLTNRAKENQLAWATDFAD